MTMRALALPLRRLRKSATGGGARGSRVAISPGVSTLSCIGVCDYSARIPLQMHHAFSRRMYTIKCHILEFQSVLVTSL